jgi:hypothetical protein
LLDVKSERHSLGAAHTIKLQQHQFSRIWYVSILSITILFSEMALGQLEIEFRIKEAEDRQREAERTEDEWRLPEAREKRERERNDAVVAKVKLFGDAMRSAAFKMSNDSIELIPNFEIVERLYDDLDVPAGLHVQLLCP